VLSLEDLQEEAEAAGKALQWEPVDLEPAVEDSVLNRVVADQFLGMINKKDREILHLRYLGFTFSEIAERLGFKTHSAVQKRIQKLGRQYECFTDTDLGFEEERLRKAERRIKFKS
jgi:DNA-directed RNA polymerase specialized sigma24 family protein